MRRSPLEPGPLENLVKIEPRLLFGATDPSDSRRVGPGPATCHLPPAELAPQWLACPIGVLRDRPEDRFDDGRADLVGKLVAVPQALRRDLNLVHELELIPELQALALGRLAPRLADRCQQGFVLKDGDRLFERLQVVGGRVNPSVGTLTSGEPPACERM